MSRIALALAFLVVLTTNANADLVQRVRTFTKSCFDCGMTNSEISIKICGNIDCCASLRLDNSNVNFLPGQTDVFEGAATLKECDQYQIGDKNRGQIQISLTHEGFDGIQLERVEIDTDVRTVTCQIGQEIDSDEWMQALCY